MAFQGSLPRHRPRLKSRACRTAAFGKLFLKRFGRIILRFASFWPTLSWRFREVCQGIGHVEKPPRASKAAAFPTPAFGKLFLKRFGRIILRFAVFWPTLSWRFRKVLATVEKPRVPYRCIRKIVLKRFGTLSWRFRKVCQSLGRVSKAARSLPLHSENCF